MFFPYAGREAENVILRYTTPLLSSSNLVYHFECPGCMKGYIGKTESTLFNRTKEHSPDEILFRIRTIHPSRRQRRWCWGGGRTCTELQQCCWGRLPIAASFCPDHGLDLMIALIHWLIYWLIYWFINLLIDSKIYWFLKRSTILMKWCQSKQRPEMTNKLTIKSINKQTTINMMLEKGYRHYYTGLNTIFNSIALG